MGAGQNEKMGRYPQGVAVGEFNALAKRPVIFTRPNSTGEKPRSLVSLGMTREGG
jgi:hypothetical protein